MNLVPYTRQMPISLNLSNDDENQCIPVTDDCQHSLNGISEVIRIYSTFAIIRLKGKAGGG